MAVPGKCNVQGAEKNAQTDNHIVASQLIPKEIADGSQNIAGPFRVNHEENTQDKDTDERHEGGDPVQLGPDAFFPGCRLIRRLF